MNLSFHCSPDSLSVNSRYPHRQFREKIKIFGEPASLTEALLLVDKLMREMPHDRFIQALLMLFTFPESTRRKIISRWQHAQFKTLDWFAPYSKYVLRVILLYIIGLSNRLIGTRVTNVVDLEYLYYLPFCMVFSSGDNFVIDMAKLLVGPTQLFLPREVLKRDLRAIADYYEADHEKRPELIKAYAANPNGIFTHPLWNTINILPWKRPSSTLDKATSDAMFQKASDIMAAIKQSKGQHETQKAGQGG